MWLVLPCPLFRSGFSLNLKWIILCWSRYRIKNLPASRICRYVDQMQNECMQIFTDGSRDPVCGKTGFGVYVAYLQIQQNIRVSDNLSVFSSELLANLWATCWTEQVKPSRNVICSDSAAALFALQGESSTAHPDLTSEILCCLLQIEQLGCHVEFSWE